MHTVQGALWQGHAALAQWGTFDFEILALGQV